MIHNSSTFGTSTLPSIQPKHYTEHTGKHHKTITITVRYSPLACTDRAIKTLLCIAYDIIEAHIISSQPPEMARYSSYRPKNE